MLKFIYAGHYGNIAAAAAVAAPNTIQGQVIIKRSEGQAGI